MREPVTITIRFPWWRRVVAALAIEVVRCLPNVGIRLSQKTTDRIADRLSDFMMRGMRVSR